MKEASIISTNGALAETVEVELALKGNIPGSFEVSRHYLVLKPFWIVNPEGTPVRVKGYYVFTTLMFRMRYSFTGNGPAEAE
jgi:hypothetical protein